MDTHRDGARVSRFNYAFLRDPRLRLVTGKGDDDIEAQVVQALIESAKRRGEAPHNFPVIPELLGWEQQSRLGKSDRISRRLLKRAGLYWAVCDPPAE